MKPPREDAASKQPNAPSAGIGEKTPIVLGNAKENEVSTFRKASDAIGGQASEFVDSVIDEASERQARLNKATAKLNELLAERRREILPDPVMLRSGKTLAEYYAFEIKALQDGKDPGKYRRLGVERDKNIAKEKFGSHPEDVFSPTYFLEEDDNDIGTSKLAEQREYEVLWRLSSQRDYVR